MLEPSPLALTPLLSSPSLLPGYPPLSALWLQLRPEWQHFYRRNPAASSGSYFPQSYLTPELQASQSGEAQPFTSLVSSPSPWLGIGTCLGLSCAPTNQVTNNHHGNEPRQNPERAIFNKAHLKALHLPSNSFDNPRLLQSTRAARKTSLHLIKSLH